MFRKNDSRIDNVIAWFRTDASQSTGVGHLMRCLALAQALSEQRVECRFIVRLATLPFCKSRIDWMWPVYTISDVIDINHELSWFSDNLEFSKTDILILDGYQFNAEYISALQQYKIPVILFDDNNDRGKMPVQMVINGAENGVALGYEHTMTNAKHCLGSQYRLLRSEFRTEAPQEISHRHSIAIVMGGTDPLGLIVPLLEELQMQNLDIPVRVLVNDSYSHLQALQQTIAQCDFAIQLLVNASDLANIFNNSRLVISAAGGTQFELLVMHTPSILLAVADNQVNATEQSQHQGWCEFFDFRTKRPLSDVVARTKQLLADTEKLEHMQKCAEKFADYDGVERIMDAILSLETGFEDDA